MGKSLTGQETHSKLIVAMVQRARESKYRCQAEPLDLSNPFRIMTWEGCFQRKPENPGAVESMFVPRGIRITLFSFALHGRVLHKVSLERNVPTG